MTTRTPFGLFTSLMILITVLSKFWLRFGGLMGLMVALGWLSFINTSQGAELSPASFTWQINVIDSTGDVGLLPSLALEPNTDKPYISYYDYTKGDLKLAFPVSNGGDCGPNNGWSCNSLAFQNTTDFGQGSSIDFNSVGNWGITYLNSSDSRNEFRGIPAAGAQEIFWDPIDGIIATSLNTMRYDQNDVSHVSYGLIDFNQAKGYIKHGKYVGFGGNCGEGLWQCEIVVQTSYTGFVIYNSISLYSNLPYIFYRDINHRLAMAVNFIGNCGSANDWFCSQIDTTTTVKGLISSQISEPILKIPTDC